MAAGRYFIVNKPGNMLSQFISNGMVGLDALNYTFPEGIHAVGRLDKESEGLLILTTNKRVTRLLFLGDKPHKRTYMVKVRYAVSAETLNRLRTGIEIRVKGGIDYITAPCDVAVVDMPDDMFDNPFESEDRALYTWLRITLTEGKYHQIRKMVRLVGHRCKRLVRTSIEQLQLNGLQPGQVREIEEQEFFSLLDIEYDSSY